jgi:hypothetical protein
MTTECILPVALSSPEMDALRRISLELRRKYNIPDHQIVADEVFEEYGFRLEYQSNDMYSTLYLKFKSPEAKTFFLLSQL